MAVTGMRTLALLQHGGATWRYHSGLGLVAAPGAGGPVRLLPVVATCSCCSVGVEGEEVSLGA
jgi:hypothetical protein